MNASGATIALVGADSGLGERLLEVFSAAGLPIETLVPLLVDANEPFVGQWQEQMLYGQSLDAFDFSTCQGVIFAAGSSISKTWVPRVVESGAWVLDLSSAFHAVESMPMVVSGINDGDVFSGKAPPAFVTVPSCMSQALCVLLHQLRALGPLHRVEVATYQSASGAGPQGVERLVTESAQILNGQAPEVNAGGETAFNVRPAIDHLLANGYTQEEARIFKECQRVLGDERLVVNVTATRVPVFYGHGAAVHAFFQRPLEWATVESCLQGASAFSWRLDPVEASSIACTREDPPVRVARVRQDWIDPCGLHLWLMYDTVQRGVAWNATQLVQRFLDYPRG